MELAAALRSTGARSQISHCTPHLLKATLPLDKTPNTITGIWFLGPGRLRIHRFAGAQLMNVYFPAFLLRHKPEVTIITNVQREIHTRGSMARTNRLEDSHWLNSSDWAMNAHLPTTLRYGGKNVLEIQHGMELGM